MNKATVRPSALPIIKSQAVHKHNRHELDGFRPDVKYVLTSVNGLSVNRPVMVR